LTLRERNGGRNTEYCRKKGRSKRMKVELVKPLGDFETGTSSEEKGEGRTIVEGKYSCSEYGVPEVKERPEETGSKGQTNSAGAKQQRAIMGKNAGRSPPLGRSRGGGSSRTN